MKKIFAVLSAIVTFVVILFGITSCGTSSQVKIGMSKSELLDIYKSDPPSYSIDGKKYYWYDDDFYNLFTKYEIDLKNSEDQLATIRSSLSNNLLKNELKELHFRYRFAKFDNDDKLMEFYYDFDHKFSLEDDYSCFTEKDIKKFELSKSKLEFFIQEKNQFKNNKNKFSLYASIVDFDNINYSVDFEDGSLFKARLKDTVANGVTIGEVQAKAHHIDLFFDVESIIGTDLPDYFDVDGTKYKIKNGKYKDLISTEVFKNMDIEFKTDFSKLYPKVLSNIKLVGYIDKDGKVLEWKTKMDYLPEDATDYDKETQETTYNGIVYEGYTINPYYKVKSVVNKNNYEISINERTQVIGEGALSNLQNLYYIDLPEGLKTIEDNAIVNNPNLMGVHIPSSVDEIGGNNFSGSPKLVEIFNESNTTNSVINNMVYDINNTYFYYKNSGYTGLNSFAFKTDNSNFYIFANLKQTTLSGTNDEYYLMGAVSTTNRTNLTLPSSFTYGGKTISSYKVFKYAFYNNPEIKTLTVPDSVTEIGVSAFNGCTNLETINANNLASIRDEAFKGCTKLNNVSLDSLSDISAGIFENCTALEEISLPSASQISDNMFKGCTSLTTVNVEQVTSVNSCAFYDCQELVNFNHNYLSYINSSAFYNCKKITDINIDDYISYIDASAFEGCTSLNTVVDNDIVYLASRNYQRRYLYKLNNKSVDTCNIPNETTYINVETFNEYTALKNLTVSDGIDFYQLCNIIDYCPSLVFTKNNNGNYIGSTTNPYLCLVSMDDKDATSFTFKDSTYYIYRQAFKDSKLSEIQVPGNITYIGDEVFKNSSLTEALLPTSVQAVGSNLFADCSNLVSAYIQCNNADSMFMNCSKLKHVELSNGNIASNMFNNCILLDELEISSINDIGSNAFYGCAKLTEIDLKDCGSIGTYAFYGCGLLEEVGKIKATYIGDYAFYGCASLEEVVFDDIERNPLNDIYIGSNAFAGCENLTSIIIPSGYNNFGSNIFENCSNLATIVIPFDAYEYVTKIFSGVTINNIFYNGTYENITRAGFDLNMLELNQNIYILETKGKPHQQGYRYWNYVDDVPTVIE